MTLRYRLLPYKRIKLLRELLNSKGRLRIVETHNGLSGVIGTSTVVQDERGYTNEFDGLWVSSLTDSAAKAHPDTEVIDTSSRLLTIQEILQVTDKPIIVDGDTGGEPTQFEYFCSKLENLGVSAVVVEDKQYPKRNSLDNDVPHILEDPYQFAAKINRAKAICLSEDFMIFTRIESFIAGAGLEDAIKRAEIYLDSCADGILIHSNRSTPDEVFSFIQEYNKLCLRKGSFKPVLCVPTTYNQVTDVELFQRGFNIVIYANQLLRACYKAMQNVCRSILINKSSHEIQEEIATVKDIMETVGFYDVKIKDASYKPNPVNVILLGSGKPVGFNGTNLQRMPVSNIPIADQPLLTWQIKALKAAGLSNITLVSGYAREQLYKNDIEEIYNENFSSTNVLYSLMLAHEKMSKGFIMIFADIFFDKEILLHDLINIESHILLLVDGSFNLRTRKSIKPTTDLVVLNEGHLTLRKPNIFTEQIADIGNDIPLEHATHEFIGIAKFSSVGAQLLRDTYDRMQKEIMTQHGNDLALHQLDFYAIIKRLIADGVKIDAKEINHGWSEVHNLTDIAVIEKNINSMQQKQKLSSRVSDVAKISD